ncbi:MAG TPA: ROK family protein [Kofleriaceae bacterium]|nr:ROK family protein [Kofleriaceae bacterium]
MASDLVVGIDVGGTNVRAAVFRGLRAAAGHTGTGPEVDRAIAEAVRPVAERREPVGRDREPDHLVPRLVGLVQALLAEAGLSDQEVPVGIGFAGMLRGEAGLVVRAPHLGWHNVPLGQLMQAALGARHRVVVENDVNAITWGEYKVGVGRGASDVLGVFIGTGIGGGAVSGGRLLTGGTGCAVEIGHTKVVIDESARPCACGLKGCVEAYAGGEYLQRRARAELAGGARSAAVAMAGGAERVNPGHLDAAAAEGDDYALTLWAEIAPLVGVALANAVTLLNPNKLILGGGVLSRTPVLREHVIAAMEVAVNPPARDGLAIESAALGDDAGLVGSALLALGAQSSPGDGLEPERG